MERISVSLIKKDKEAVEKIARDRRVSIAWVVREAVLEFLDRQASK
ncbi:MAG: ribbon-helix-helix domain-containing protein [Verrucomicrobiia bacterium]